MQNKLTIGLLLAPALLLLIPAIAMKFTSDVAWSLSDFVFMGVLLYGASLLYILLARTTGSTAYRGGAGMAIVTAFLLIWVNGAVGIIGSENNPANALYAGVLIVLFLGAIVSRFKAMGLERTMYTVAAAQMLVPVVTFVTWRPDFTPGVLGVFMLNAIFASLWVGSGLLFRHADETSNESVTKPEEKFAS